MLTLFHLSRFLAKLVNSNIYLQLYMFSVFLKSKQVVLASVMQTTILICFKGDIFKVNLQFLCVFLDIKREAQNLFFFKKSGIS